jgi:predicted metal-dependent phosphoesterase TrpH
MTLKIDLHTHTGRYSSCSRLSPRELCETALARGLDAVAITEHHHQWSADEIAELQARYPALKLYTGVEITCTDRHDYVVLGLHAGPYQPNPMSYARFQTLLEERRRAGALVFAFLAHGFRYSDDEGGLETAAIEGIEMASPNMLARPQPADGPVTIARAELYRRWQQRRSWIPLYNSDAHSTTMLGQFYNLVDAPEGAPGGVPADERALIQLLRTARIRGFADEARILRGARGGIRARIGAVFGGT